MGAILGFHSVTTRELHADGDAHVPFEFFKGAVHLARRLGEIVPLDTLIRRHVEGRSTAGLVALTLDDAYAALVGPFAEFVAKECVPLSVFVVTQAAETGSVFWWDRVDDAFPRVSRERWHAFERECGLPDEYRLRQPRSYGPLRPLRQWLLARYAGRWPRQLEPALASLENDAGTRTRHRAMSLAELESFARLTTVDFGVHTVSHPVLPLLSDEQLRHEIVEAHGWLRSRFDRTLPVLAFPFALYDRRTVDVARAAGMTACLTLAGTVVRAGDDVGSLARMCLTKRDTLLKLGARLLGLPEAMRPWTGRRLPAYPDLPSAAT